MSKKIIFILFLLSFFAGYFLREMFYGISNVSTASKNVVILDKSDIKPAPKENEQIFEVVKLVVPKKVIRGNPFEVIAYFKPPKTLYGNYNLSINLCSINGDVKVNAGQFRLVITKEWLENQIVKVGPFGAVASETTPLGKYNIEMGLRRSEKAKEDYAFLPYLNSNIDYPDGMIEITKYN